MLPEEFMDDVIKTNLHLLAARPRQEGTSSIAKEDAERLS
jgi:hypothetical protein